MPHRARLRACATKDSPCALAGTAAVWPGLLYPQLLHLEEQGVPVDIKGPSRPQPVPVRPVERAYDILPLEGLHGLPEVPCLARPGLVVAREHAYRQGPERGVPAPPRGRPREPHKALHQVLELPYVPGPGVVHERAYHVGQDALYALAAFAAELLEEVLHEERN